MFWDASAVVPCLVPEVRSQEMTSLLASDEAIAVWWATGVECVSALERKRRDLTQPLPPRVYTTGRRRLALLLMAADQVEVSELLRERAVLYLERHPLRAADALQLAAAFVSHHITIVCLDDRLRLAAISEGFRVLP